MQTKKENIEKWLNGLLEGMLIEPESLEIEQSESENEVVIDLKVKEEDSGVVIGYRGETLAAIQRLLRIIFMPKAEDEVGEKTRLVLNINEYRQEREKKLRLAAYNAGMKVLQNGSVYRMRDLSAAERFIVHDEINSNLELSELESFSEGDRIRTLVIRIRQD